MHSAAAALRLQIETALQPRIPGALTPRPRVIRDLQATGIRELDTLLEGGLPIGAISELVGALCSGRTTLALATLAEMTQSGKTVAWIDTSDALDPESAAAAGVDLARQLWVRCGYRSTASPFAGAAVGGAFSPALLVEGSHVPAPSGGGGSPHPRSEVRGLPEAVDAFLNPDVFSRPAPPRDPIGMRRNRLIGTPGAPNRKLVPSPSSTTSPQPRKPLDRTPQDPRPFPRRSVDREEQIPTDRQPSRRQVLYTRQQAEAKQAKSLQASQIANTAKAARQRQHPAPGSWTDNRHNAAGRSLGTAPNAIAAGLPRFQQMEARNNRQENGPPNTPLPWKPEVHKPHSAAAATSLAGDPPPRGGRATSPFWHALDQALRATDLLLAAGGFSAVVLDLGGIPPEFAWRIPLATWFRFRAAADRARTVLLLLTQHACARSSAELVLRLGPAEPHATATLFIGATFRIDVDRRRFETQPSPEIQAPGTTVPPGKLHLVSQHSAGQRKPPQRAAAWSRSAVWAVAATASATDGAPR